MLNTIQETIEKKTIFSLKAPPYVYEDLTPKTIFLIYNWSN